MVLQPLQPAPGGCSAHHQWQASTIHRRLQESHGAGMQLSSKRVPALQAKI